MSEKRYTKKELAAHFEIGDTTVRDTLRACDFDTKLQEYPADEIHRIFAPARVMLKAGKLKDLTEVTDWALKEREKLGLPGSSGFQRVATPRSETEDGMIGEIWEYYAGVIREHLAANPTRIFNIAQREINGFAADGRLAKARELKLQEEFQKEIRSVRPRHRHELPFSGDDVIDLDAEDLEDDGDDLGLSP